MNSEEWGTGTGVSWK